MQTITYRKNLKITWKDDLLLVSFSMFLLGLSLAFNRAIDSEILRIIVLLLCLLAAAGFFRLALPSRNSLRLNEDGLTYKHAGHSGVWLWRDISAFTLARGWRGSRIEFTVSEGNRLPRLVSRRKTKAGLTGTIPNIWDTPIEDITTTLNAYREQALSGGAA